MWPNSPFWEFEVVKELHRYSRLLFVCVRVFSFLCIFFHPLFIITVSSMIQSFSAEIIIIIAHFYRSNSQYVN